MKKQNIFAGAAALLVATSILVTSCGGNNASSSSDSSDGQGLKGRVSLSGAFALYPLAVKWAEEFKTIHPDVRIEVDGGGAGKGMTDALSGQVEFGMVSREISPAEVEKGAVGFAVAIDAVVPTINPANPLYDQIIAHGITQQEARAIWIEGTIKTWGQLLGTADATPIAVFTRSDACGAAETFANWLGGHQEDLLGEGVNGDPGVATAVTKNVNAAGLNNIGYVYDNNSLQPLDGIRPLPVDVNANGTVDADEQFYAIKSDLAKAIADGKYPAPPARNLYLVSKGKPTDPAARAFLEYVLTQGQKLNAVAGYIGISQESLDESLRRLKE